MTEPITVLVADDHPMFRAAVVHTLGAAVAARVLEASSQSGLEAALAVEPAVDLVLLDLAMPGAIGFSSLLWLRAEYPDLPVIVISSNDRPRTVRRAQQFGAAGFVSKAAPVEALGEAVRTVLDGGLAFEASRAERSPEDAALAARLARLTPQQFRVLMLLAEGLLNKQIADRLGLAENTVKIHVTAVLSKLECRSRTQAAVLVKSLDLEEESAVD
ncbi:response regulator [Fulvimonas soli]|jgi:DNA-binding NarL/FixJ family response regulator|uniref:LuxR family two component transcriptional regulator n=1 Tax=Fulvimonas soli TaxID=155197 RepID=A0A316IZM7_9GAMM|nr:response regulator transcription factor [Fulvimonas soli]PWK92725.1 LuxR family two component transcriptional regulator [Fulvimonas soli]TNY25894.1 DNA-binding response regulator [Fulvimonas soli]